MTQTDTRPLVLVIDDDALIQRYMQIALDKAGFRSLGVQDPRKAVSLLKEERPDLVLLDVRLPDVDGFELFESIRQVSSCPVVFLTASSSPQDRAKAMSAGADGFVVKPFTPRELVTTINGVLGREG